MCMCFGYTYLAALCTHSCTLTHRQKSLQKMPLQIVWHAHFSIPFPTTFELPQRFAGTYYALLSLSTINVTNKIINKRSLMNYSLLHSSGN